MGTEFWICTEGLRVFPFCFRRKYSCVYRRNQCSAGTEKSKFLTSHGLCRANGEFELYEDDNVSCAYEERICCTTKMVYCEDEKPIFTIYPSAGNRDLIPQKRSYTVEMTGFENSGETVVVRKMV